jgi:hypothetical protein
MAGHPLDQFRAERRVQPMFEIAALESHEHAALVDNAKLFKIYVFSL